MTTPTNQDRPTNRDLLLIRLESGIDHAERQVAEFNEHAAKSGLHQALVWAEKACIAAAMADRMRTLAAWVRSEQPDDAALLEALREVHARMVEQAIRFRMPTSTSAFSNATAAATHEGDQRFGRIVGEAIRLWDPSFENALR